MNRGKSKIFNSAESHSPGRSVFDLSHEKKFTADMGQLIPVMCDEVVPGDYWQIGCTSIIRMPALVSPVLHQVESTVHYFFVPYRLMWSSWEDFITGGVDGQNSDTIPTWEPTDNTIGSLWDYLGFPTGIDPDGAYPIDFPRIAYNYVYNEYYRDQTLQTEVALTNESILNRCWEKDYFTSALPWQQRGIAPALPISGSTFAEWQDVNIVYGDNSSYAALRFRHDVDTDNKAYLNDNESVVNARTFFNNNEVDLSSATTFDVADLRLAFQIQKWMERNARSGARYTEFLTAHFGVAPRDERLQRPEYIGGTKSPIIISEVLQTSSTDATTPQGNLAGHGISVNQDFCGKYHSNEYGLIIGIMSVMPKPSYQDGINRQWLKSTKFDFFFPEFANLSEQAIINAEICATDTDTHNLGIFGYQGRYDEMRYKPNQVSGLMRTDFDFWHLGRQFDTAAPPTLNAEFVEVDPTTLKRIFAVPSEPGLFISHGNLIKAVRPIPWLATPGLIDHN